jgi:hypothetical protein
VSSLAVPDRKKAIILTLLEWWKDVTESWNDGAGAGDFGQPMLNPALNHPSYRELERLRIIMRVEEPVLYWNLRERYLVSVTRNADVCPVCHKAGIEATEGLPHRHKLEGRLRKVEPVRAVVTVVSKAVRPELVDLAVGWLADNFRGEPFVPDGIDEKKQEKVAA